jgi:hypothetical protein
LHVLDAAGGEAGQPPPAPSLPTSVPLDVSAPPASPPSGSDTVPPHATSALATNAHPNPFA